MDHAGWRSEHTAEWTDGDIAKQGITCLVQMFLIFLIWHQTQNNNLIWETMYSGATVKKKKKKIRHQTHNNNLVWSNNVEQCNWIFNNFFLQNQTSNT